MDNALPAAMSANALRFRDSVGAKYMTLTTAVRSRAGGAIAVIALAVAVFGLLVYVTLKIVSTNLKTVTLQSSPVHAITQTKTISGDELPASKNGLEFSLSFWVYIESSTNTQDLKTVLTIGSSSKTLGVYMDRSSNKMMIAVRTNQSSTAVMKEVVSSHAAAADTAGASASQVLIMEVDYTPLMRWVNLVVTINNDVATLYVDGDIYATYSVKAFTGGGVPLIPQGTVTIGGAGAVNGYVSKLQVCNYSLNVYHTRAIYNAGPTPNTFSWLIPSNLKFQWPLSSSG